MTQAFRINRRDFVKIGLTAGSALVLGVPIAATVDTNKGSGTRDQSIFSPSVFISIDRNSRVTCVIPEIEMGQGVKTSLAMLIAEELEAKWDDITIITPHSLSEIGTIGTSSSMSVRSNWDQLLLAGATAREMLKSAAATLWKVNTNECIAQSSTIRHINSTRVFRFGELIDQANKIAIPKNIVLKQADKYRMIGQSIPDYEGYKKVTGKIQYGIDVDIAGMLLATVIHPPVFGAKVRSFDQKDTAHIPGVKSIFKISSGIAVVANTFWAAKKAAEALKINWDLSHSNRISNFEINQKYMSSLEHPGKTLRHKREAQSNNQKLETLNAIYEIPFQAHAQMEPMNCTASVTDDLCEVWAPTQNTYGAQYESAKYYYSSFKKKLRALKRRLGLQTRFEDILVHPVSIGGAFGRRLKQDYVGEAVQISKRIKKPVKVIWTREEDMQHGFYRPYTVHKIKSQLDSRGYPLSWHHHIVGPTESICTGGALELPYYIPDFKVQFTQVALPVPIGSWRSVGHSHNITVIESFIDKLAHHNNIDPLEYRLSLLKHEHRCMNVLSLAAKQVNWDKRGQTDKFMGIALVKEYGSVSAQIAVISVLGNKVTVHKIVCVVDCGTAVNPDNIRAQIEGGIIFGLTAAIKSCITIKNGRVEQRNFNDFPLISIKETPEIETILVKNSDFPGGIGELAVPPIAPAIMNAIFAATGKSITTLPMSEAIV